jgi:hypothetical protein
MHNRFFPGPTINPTPCGPDVFHTKDGVGVQEPHPSVMKFLGNLLRPWLGSQKIRSIPQRPW